MGHVCEWIAANFSFRLHISSECVQNLISSITIDRVLNFELGAIFHCLMLECALVKFRTVSSAPKLDLVKWVKMNLIELRHPCFWSGNLDR